MSVRETSIDRLRAKGGRVEGDELREDKVRRKRKSVTRYSWKNDAKAWYVRQ